MPDDLLNIQNTPIIAPATDLDYFLHTKWKKTGFVDTVCISPFSLPLVFLQSLAKAFRAPFSHTRVVRGEKSGRGMLLCTSEEVSLALILKEMAGHPNCPLSRLRRASVDPPCPLPATSHAVHTSLLTLQSARLALVLGFSLPTAGMVIKSSIIIYF